MGCLLAVLLLLITGAVSFLITAGIVWVICWAFGFLFTWKLVIGIWAVLFLLRTVFNVTVKKD